MLITVTKCTRYLRKTCSLKAFSKKNKRARKMRDFKQQEEKKIYKRSLPFCCNVFFMPSGRRLTLQVFFFCFWRTHLSPGITGDLLVIDRSSGIWIQSGYRDIIPCLRIFGCSAAVTETRFMPTVLIPTANTNIFIHESKLLCARSALIYMPRRKSVF